MKAENRKPITLKRKEKKYGKRKIKQSKQNI
jgi:hypothetical protein